MESNSQHVGEVANSVYSRFFPLSLSLSLPLSLQDQITREPLTLTVCVLKFSYTAMLWGPLNVVFPVNKDDDSCIVYVVTKKISDTILVHTELIPQGNLKKKFSSLKTCSRAQSAQMRLSVRSLSVERFMVKL